MAQTSRPKPAKQTIGYKNAKTQVLAFPNIITIFRLLALPAMMVLLLKKVPNAHVIAAAIFALSGALTPVDGFIARRTNNLTTVGQLLDSWANKVVVIGAMLLLLNEQIAPVILPILISARELYALILRAMAHERNILLANTPLTPVKNALEFIGPTLLLLSPVMGTLWKTAGTVTMTVAIALAWFTAGLYTVNLFSILKCRQQL